MSKASISFFEVKSCGFFCLNAEDGEAELVEGSLESTIASFCEWVKDRDFDQTIPWDVDSHPRRTQIYCKSFAFDSITKDSLLVLWKRYDDDSGKVSGILPGAKVGSDANDSIKIDSAIKGQRAILGQPMYYWFIPELSMIATINFSHSSAATKEVCDYIKRCVDYRIPHPRKVCVEDGVESLVVDSSVSRKSISFVSEFGNKKMRFKFSANTKELDSKKANYKVLSEKISHIVVRDTISTASRDDRDPVFRLWSKVEARKKFSKKIEITEEVKLTPKEVEDIIRLHECEYDPKNKWNNIGFKEEGQDYVKWFSKYTSRENITLPDLDVKHNYYAAGVVLQELVKNREDLLLQIKSINLSPVVAGVKF